jgi:eukaryotic-like serine/threonine-protein kinase
MSRVWTFGTAVFNQVRHLLKVDGHTHRIDGRGYQILCLLLEAGGDLVTRDDMAYKIWQDPDTEDQAIERAVNRLLRDRLGSNRDYILQVRKEGWRFDCSREPALQWFEVDSPAAASIDLRKDAAVPNCRGFILERLLAVQPPAYQLWRARGSDNSTRTFKFGLDGGCLPALRWEAEQHRKLELELGRDALARGFLRLGRVNLEYWPFWLEYEDFGQTLAVWAAEDGRLEKLALATRRDLCIQICEKVMAAQNIVVLHENLSPRHIQVALIGEEIQVKIWGFGSSPFLDDLGGLAAGSAPYVAPELLTLIERGPTRRSLSWSAGCLVAQLLAGDLRSTLHPGWEEDHPPQIVKAIASTTHRKPERRGELAELTAVLKSWDAASAGQDVPVRRS